MFKVVIDSRTPMDKTAILEKQFFGSIKVFTATQDIIDQDRFVDTLPISFDTYKFIKDDPFLMISEYLQINSDSPLNTITFTVT